MSKINIDNHSIINSSLRLIKQCPVCSTKYVSRKVQIIDYAESGVLLHFSCPTCFSSLLANVTEMPFGLVGSAMLTDLQAEEVLKFKNKEKVTSDDVLDVYERLES